MPFVRRIPVALLPVGTNTSKKFWTSKPHRIDSFAQFNSGFFEALSLCGNWHPVKFEGSHRLWLAWCRPKCPLSLHFRYFGHRIGIPLSLYPSYLTRLGDTSNFDFILRMNFEWTSKPHRIDSFDQFDLRLLEELSLCGNGLLIEILGLVYYVV